MNHKIVVSFIAIYCLAAGLGFFLSDDSTNEDVVVASYILQGKSTAAVADAVESVNGQITHRFRMINAVAATLTPRQKQILQENPAILAISDDVPERPVASTS